jgi:hypothetical protein
MLECYKADRIEHLNVIQPMYFEVVKSFTLRLASRFLLHGVPLYLRATRRNKIIVLIYRGSLAWSHSLRDTRNIRAIEALVSTTTYSVQ